MARPRSVEREIVAAVSRRKQIFSDAASSVDSGGVNRVFTRPACGAFVMMASATRPDGTRSPFDGSRMRWVAFMPACSLGANETASTLFAKRVLISPFAPGLDLSPWLSGKETIHLAQGQNAGTRWFAVAVIEVG